MGVPLQKKLFFIYCCHLKIKKIFYFRQLIDIWKKYHVKTYNLSVGIFICLLQYFSYNDAILVQKLGEEKILSKSVSSYFICGFPKHTSKQTTEHT